MRLARPRRPTGLPDASRLTVRISPLDAYGARSCGRAKADGTPSSATHRTVAPETSAPGLTGLGHHTHGSLPPTRSSVPSAAHAHKPAREPARKLGWRAPTRRRPNLGRTDRPRTPRLHPIQALSLAPPSRGDNRRLSTGKAALPQTANLRARGGRSQLPASSPSRRDWSRVLHRPGRGHCHDLRCCSRSAGTGQHYGPRTRACSPRCNSALQLPLFRHEDQGHQFSVLPARGVGTPAHRFNQPAGPTSALLRDR